MFKLTAIICTLNEERNIARCIDSLKNVADEIIVVDSFSVDRTKEICQAKGAKFIEKGWEGYAAQKNFAQQQASNDCIISLDADEAVSPVLAEEIKKIKNGTEFQLYEFNRLNNYCGKWIHHSGWYPDPKLRMYNRNECKWEGDVHEWPVYPASAKVIFLRGDLLHYSFYTVEEHRAKARKYAKLASQKIAEKGKMILLLRAVISPFFRFMKMYFFQLGFLDGMMGLRICWITSGEVFLKYKLAAGLRK